MRQISSLPPSAHGKHGSFLDDLILHKDQYNDALSDLRLSLQSKDGADRLNDSLSFFAGTKLPLSQKLTQEITRLVELEPLAPKPHNAVRTLSGWYAQVDKQTQYTVNGQSSRSMYSMDFTPNLLSFFFLMEAVRAVGGQNLQPIPDPDLELFNKRQRRYLAEPLAKVLDVRTRNLTELDLLEFEIGVPAVNLKESVPQQFVNRVRDQNLTDLHRRYEAVVNQLNRVDPSGNLTVICMLFARPTDLIDASM